MNKENLYKPFEIIVAELDKCPKQEHTHNFFELVYILSGTGMQCINKNKFAYHPGHMFLITPEDCHSFEIETTTKFFFIRFNDIYIKSGSFQADTMQRLEFILQNANHQPGCILRNRDDRELVKPVVEAIAREYYHRDLYNKELVYQLVNTLIVVVARNIAKYLPASIHPQTEEKALNILHYIQSNIYYPEKIKSEYISRHFGISLSYLGRYFKKQTNETLQEYISSYKIKLIETRLLNSALRITEIADEMGFADESHLNKFFRKHRGTSPTAFRKAFLKKNVIAAV